MNSDTVKFYENMIYVRAKNPIMYDVSCPENGA